MQKNSFYVANAVDFMRESMPPDCVDLTVTSPPYENLRHYDGYEFDAEAILGGLFRVTCPGGVVVWVVGDKINGGRSLVSFEQALLARDIGFIIHDVMIYQKKNTPFMRSNAYTNCFEFMFILAKGKPKTFNPLKQPTKRHGMETAVSNKGPDAVNRKVPVELKKEKTRTNIWPYAVGLGGPLMIESLFNIRLFFPKNWLKIIFYHGQIPVIWYLIPCVVVAQLVNVPRGMGENGWGLIFPAPIFKSRVNA